MRKYNILLTLSKKEMNLAVDLRNVSENFGVEILNNLNSVKSILKKSPTLLRVHEI
jgi:hypothetical protein